jgi:hypothetical protein
MKMAQHSLVTVATDGFRDYVDLPDGRRVNLGSVSVLKLVSSLVSGSYQCRRALDTFLKKKQAIIAVDLSALEDLLKPKRARWAAYDDPFISTDSVIAQSSGITQPSKGAGMDSENAQKEAIRAQITELESQIALIEQTVKDHASGSQSKEQLQSSVESLKRLVSELGKEPKGQSDNGAFYFKLAGLEETLTRIEGCGCATEEDVASFHTTASDLFVEVTGMTIKAAVDKDVLEDLDVFMENTGSLDSKKMIIINNLKRKIEAGNYDANQAPKAWMHWIEDGIKAYAREFSVNPRSMFPMDLKKELADRLSKRYEGAIKNGDFGSVTPKTAAEGEVSGPAPEVAKGTGIQDPYSGKPLSDNDTYYKLADEADVGTAPVAGTAEEVAKTTKVENPYSGKDQSKNEMYYKLAASDVPFINEAFADSVMSKVESTLRTVEASTKKGSEIARKDLNIITSRLATLIETSSLDDPSLSVALRKLSGMVDQIQSHFA